MAKALKLNAPELLAKNLSALLENSGRSQAKVAKDAGIAQTSVSLMLRPEARKIGKRGKVASPLLGDVEAVAQAFGLQAWQLLIDPAVLGETVANALSGKNASDERLAERGITKPETQKS